MYSFSLFAAKRRPDQGDTNDFYMNNEDEEENRQHENNPSYNSKSPEEVSGACL